MPYEFILHLYEKRYKLPNKESQRAQQSGRHPTSDIDCRSDEKE
jgi:hypothetical protein